MKELIKGIAMILSAILLMIAYYTAMIAIPIVIIALAVKWVIN